ncbi:hypothetical protein GGX14DRAFT_408843 [Mycena pura]|uniref:Uncharacterized protein n=1 Tax=Mycena pura TaxID=153505 RepID=A0AAD6XXG1_9AGAR|nr:hypothetical protein GGX14DRAFT_408843 [Mycena pura]
MVIKSSKRKQPSGRTARSAISSPAAHQPNYDLLYRWIEAADLKGYPDLGMKTPLPANLAMCELFVSLLEVGSSRFQGHHEPTYHLLLAAYHPLVGQTVDMHIQRFDGFPDDADAPPWVSRVLPFKLLYWPQPLDFVGKVVGGMTNIPVTPISVRWTCRQMIKPMMINCAWTAGRETFLPSPLLPANLSRVVVQLKSVGFAE